MECVRNFKIKQNVNLKLYSDVETYKKMFFIMLVRYGDEADRELENGTLKDFDEVMEELFKELGIKDKSL